MGHLETGGRAHAEPTNGRWVLGRTESHRHLELALQTYLRFTLRHRRAVLGLAVLSVLVALAITAARLEFSTDRTQLLDPDHPVQQGYRTFRQQFGANTDLVVLVSGNPEEVRSAVDELGRALTEDTAYFKDVLYRLELPEVARHSLYYLSSTDLEWLKAQAHAIRGWLPPPGARFPELLEALDGRSDAEALALLKPMTSILASGLEGMLASLDTRGEGEYKSPIPVFVPEVERLSGGSFKPGQTVFYNNVGGDRVCMVIARPVDTSGSFSSDVTTIARLRGIVARVSLSYPEVNCLVSGEPVINTDEMVGARDDSLKCSLAALVLVSGLLAAAFFDLLRPFFAVISLLVGLSWSFAFAALTIGTLNLLTVHFATILVGLCMTFAIQLLAHYQDLRHRGGGELNPHAALEQAVAETGPQTGIGAVTTAVAFLSLQFTNFRAAGELGLITGMGVLLTFVAIWTLLPIFLDMTEEGRQAHPLNMPGFEAMGRVLAANSGWALVISLLVTLYSLTWVNRVPFNYNLLSLQAPNNDAVRVEHLLQSLGYSSLYAVATAPDVAAAEKLAQRLESLPSVSHVESVANLLPREVERKRAAVREILEASRRAGDTPLPTLDDFLRSGEPYRSAKQLLELRANLQRSAPRMNRLMAALPKSKERERLTRAFSKLERLLSSGSPGPLEAGLRVYEKRMYEELEEYRKFLLTQEPEPPNVLDALPEALRTRSISAEGNFSLRIFPKANTWEREPLQQFVTQLRAADPTVTGTPLLIYYYLEELRLAYSGAGRNALLVIAGLLLLHYRSLVQMGLALFPKLLGVVWMIGLMGVFGQSFNAANFLALPITLGIGLVFGVNILSECRANGVASLYGSATGGGVLLSGMVATLGFAAFMLANHVGVASFGFVMAAGVGANMLTSLITLPALLDFWRKRRPSE